MDKRGFTLVELLVTLGLFTFVGTMLFRILLMAQSNFFNADAGIDLRNSLRLVSEKVAAELRNTGYQNNAAQFTISTGAGTGGSDIIRFSMPILCSSTSTLVNSSGVPANWGAPLTWGCNSYTCMDANGNCSTLEYKYVQFSLNNSNQVERKVLNSALATVNNSTTSLGGNISNFKVALSNDGHVMTLTLTGTKTSVTRRTFTETYTRKILLNNLNG